MKGYLDISYIQQVAVAMDVGMVGAEVTVTMDMGLAGTEVATTSDDSIAETKEQYPLVDGSFEVTVVLVTEVAVTFDKTVAMTGGKVLSS